MPSDDQTPGWGPPPPGWGPPPLGWGPPPPGWGPEGPTEQVPELDGQPRRTSPLTVATGGLSIAGGLVLVGIETAVSQAAGSTSEPPVFLLLAIVFLVGRGVQEIAGWWFRTYQVTPDRLVIDEGMLTRHHRVVPFERVQQIDVSQSLIGQVLGLAALRVDTAGESGATTVHLRLLERRRAEGLRTYVLHRRATLQAARAADGRSSTPGSSAGPAPAPTPARSLLRLGPGQLAVANLAGPLGTVLAVVTVLSAIAAVALATAGEAATAAGALVAVLLLGASVAALATFSMVLALWDLRVEQIGDDLRLQHGLLQVRSLTVPRRRVQHVSVVDGPLQRALGFVALTLHSAASGQVQVEGGKGGTSPTFTIPYVRRAAMATTLHDLLGGDWHAPPLTPRGAAAHGRTVRRRAVVCGIGCLPALLAGPEAVLVVVAGAAVGALWGIDAHRRAGWAETPTLVVLAHGALIHRTELVPVNRVQSARCSSSPFQRRVSLATLHLDVAGRHAPHLFDLEADVADDLRRRAPRRAAGGGPTTP